MTIALKKDNEVLKTQVTEDSGDFKFDLLLPGKYKITAIAIGYHSKNVDTEITGSNTIDLGEISVSSQTNNLQEVAISGDRPIIKQEVDRISYDIQADPESKVLTVLDMMRKVPLLSLDADDNIKLKGSGNYKILINGKPSSMVVRSPKDVLKSMPASSIQKIEVITTPPSKYDSEGLSGIINIITTKKIDNGYNGSLTLRAAIRLTMLSRSQRKVVPNSSWKRFAERMFLFALVPTDTISMLNQVFFLICSASSRSVTGVCADTWYRPYLLP